MPPPITSNMLNSASFKPQPQQQQQFGMNSYASPTTTNVYYQVPMQQSAPMTDMIPNNGKANYVLNPTPIHQQYLGTMHTSSTVLDPVLRLVGVTSSSAHYWLFGNPLYD